jgi:hypothetical protein
MAMAKHSISEYGPLLKRLNIDGKEYAFYDLTELDKAGQKYG